MAHNSLYQWSRAQYKNTTPTAALLTSEDGRERWTKPVEDTIKINVDAALFNEERKFSLAGVARNYSGQVLEARTSCRTGDVTPEMAEALGVREVLSWIKGKEWQKVIVETDSLTVVQCLRSNLPMLSYFGSVISECKDLLKELPNVAVFFIRRSANSVAHYLARASYYVADRVISGEDISPECLHVILNDCY